MITFTSNSEKGFFESKYVGTVDDNEMLNSYKEYFEDPNTTEITNEFTDLSECLEFKITSGGLKQLSDYSTALFNQLGIENFKAAVFAPSDLTFGMTRMYQVYTDEMPENVRVFRNKNDALDWLIQE